VEPATRLDVLHDHYKETFSYIREREKQRDRLFLVLIGLFALLVLEIQYPAGFGDALGKVKILDAEVDLSVLPLPGLLGVSWVLTFAIALRYCQAAINADRQYGYLHGLEDKISAELGDDALYRREGRSYLEEYPLFQDWAWICYVFLFPAIAALGTLALIVVEVTRLPYPLLSKALDGALAAAVILTFYLYRWHPPKQTFVKLKNTLKERWDEWHEQRDGSV
jgi:hypothetical protein